MHCHYTTTTIAVIEHWFELPKTGTSGRYKMPAMTKICPMCRLELPMEAFYRKRRGDGVNVYCKRCAIEQTVTRQRLLKAQAIAHKGGRCQRCGYNRCDGALEFHHRDPAEKDFSLGHVGTTTFEKIKAELEKCDLLCANCHREVHAQVVERPLKPVPMSSGTISKRCPSCHEDLPIEAFYDRRFKRGAASFCKFCTCQGAIRRQRHQKQRAVNYKGSRCQRCGYDRCVGSLEFHHRDPTQKDFTLSRAKMRRFELVKDELDKCDLLCVNCHREEHARMAEH
jgi:hypothetical protein